MCTYYAITIRVYIHLYTFYIRIYVYKRVTTIITTVYVYRYHAKGRIRTYAIRVIYFLLFPMRRPQDEAAVESETHPRRVIWRVVYILELAQAAPFPCHTISKYIFVCGVFAFLGTRREIAHTLCIWSVRAVRRRVVQPSGLSYVYLYKLLQWSISVVVNFCIDVWSTF